MARKPDEFLKVQIGEQSATIAVLSSAVEELKEQIEIRDEIISGLKKQLEPKADAAPRES